MQLKDYQETAIKELLDKAKKLLGYSGEKKIVFKSPTGSGKTIVMAEFLKQLVNDREVKIPLSFIWTVPRPTLTNQSKEKLERYFEDSRALKCSFYDDLDDVKIAENEILFINWESINKADAIYIRENERENNLSNVLVRTKAEGREIILIIDEVHHHSESDISQGLIEMMGPKLTIGVSATPKMSNPNDSVTVQLEDVKKEGMIKKSLLLNPDFVNVIKNGKIENELTKGTDKDTEELVLTTALKKRQELLTLYQKESDINPLVLVQLPDRLGSLEDEVKERVKRILKDKHNISTENGKLAVWLSGEHINKENVEKHNSEVEVLIFKQAISLGWDCPRAQILALFREWHSAVFSVQTVGRIMRMPEPDKGHYDEEALNYGYVYTNLDSILIEEDIDRGYVTIYTSKRKKGYHPVDLRSYHSVRHREQTRLAPRFIEIFLQEAKIYDLKNKVDKESKEINIGIISDKKAEDIDALIGTKWLANKNVKATTSDLEKLFNFFIREHLTPFYPEDRSVGRVRDAIYRFFARDLAMFYQESEDEIIQILFGERNFQYFINVLEIAKQKYKEETEKREAELEIDENWNVPEKEQFNGDYIAESREKCIMEPFYTKNEWKTEIAFIDFLETQDKVDWWFKNGDRDAVYFAVPYKSGDKPAPFYVDFIVKMKDGRIGLFDTKSGRTIRDAGSKIDGLSYYIQKENEKGKKLFSGIVTNTDARNYKGRWICFNKPSNELRDNNLDNWDTLEL